MLNILIFLILHWYLSLFFQSFFHHRYAAHGQCSMSRSWEKFFFICCFITQGSSYISASAYGMMHRLHHAHTDEEQDPHSPHFEPNPFLLLLQTRNNYHSIYKGFMPVDEKYKKGLPEWEAFDKYAHTWVARLAWGLIYLSVYIWLATEWWMYLFLPLTLAMGALQGLGVNWWAHKFGYENFKLTNTSKNMLPVDFLFVGEGYHNNHHKYPGRPNHATRWFEFDLTYHIMLLMQRMRIIRLAKAPAL